MRIRALIVDDEYPAREELRFQLKDYRDIEVVGEAATIDEASVLIKALEYDLVFLDINFPVKNGIELGMEIATMDHPPMVIYITAYDQYAVQAFRVDAIDYLLKPIDPQDLERAVKKAFRFLENRKNDEGDINLHKPESVKGSHRGDLNKVKPVKLSAELRGRIHLIDLEDVYFAYVEDNYVFVKMKEETMMTRYTLTSLEEKIGDYGFFRTNRSYLVNLKQIKEISPFFNGSCHLTMKDRQQSEIPVSRRQARELKQILIFDHVYKLKPLRSSIDQRGSYD